MTWLVSFEGIDGSGKTTLIKNLKKKVDFDLVTQSWRDTKLGKKIWHLLDEARGEKESNLPSNWSYIFLILTAFDELVKKIIKPNLLEKKIVIVDRYIDSTFVYQGLEGNIKIDVIQEIAQKTINLPLPDLTFILDIEPQEAQERLNKRKAETGEYTNWDNLKLDFHQRIRNNYLKLKKIFPERIYIIDARKNEEEVVEEVGEIIKQLQYPKENLPKFVRVIVRNEKGEILLVKDKKWGWNLPGGRIEKNETPEEAAQREVFEETNLVLENYEKIGKKNIFYANLEKGNQMWEGHFYRASKYSGEIQIKEAEKGKILDVKFININSALEINENRHSWEFYLETINKMTSKVHSKKNTLIIIAGGSGTGKTTVGNLLNEDPSIVKIITTTTRPKREGEADGQDYYFISTESFRTELKKGRFLEHVIYDGNYYGIHGKVIDLILGTQKKNGVVIVDVVGFRQIKKYCQEKGYQTVSCWFQAESIKKMVEHMEKRGANETEIIRRLIIEEKEEKFASEFDYILTIKEDSLTEAAQEIKKKLANNT